MSDWIFDLLGLGFVAVAFFAAGYWFGRRDPGVFTTPDGQGSKPPASPVWKNPRPRA